MDIATVISLLQVVVAEAPGVISTGEELVNLGTKFYETVNGHVPTIAEVAELRAAIDADVILALQPLPPAQPGDPDYLAPASPPVETPTEASPPIVPNDGTDKT